jgi:hypothetical protein
MGEVTYVLVFQNFMSSKFLGYIQNLIVKEVFQFFGSCWNPYGRNLEYIGRLSNKSQGLMY